MSEASTSIGEWVSEDLVDPRGREAVATNDARAPSINAWPIKASPKQVGLFSNKKPNADAMLDEVKRGLLEVDPDLTFVYGSKEPLAEKASPAVIDTLRDCDVVVLASAECGGCTSWVCHDYITLETLGVPSILIATNKFEGLARGVLTKGGVTHPHMVIPKHPVSGITAAQAQQKIRELMGRFTSEVFGPDAAVAPKQVEAV